MRGTSKKSFHARSRVAPVWGAGVATVRKAVVKAARTPSAMKRGTLCNVGTGVENSAARSTASREAHDDRVTRAAMWAAMTRRSSVSESGLASESAPSVDAPGCGGTLSPSQLLESELLDLTLRALPSQAGPSPSAGGPLGRDSMSTSPSCSSGRGSLPGSREGPSGRKTSERRSNAAAAAGPANATSSVSWASAGM